MGSLDIYKVEASVSCKGADLSTATTQWQRNGHTPGLAVEGVPRLRADIARWEACIGGEELGLGADARRGSAYDGCGAEGGSVPVWWERADGGACRNKEVGVS